MFFAGPGEYAPCGMFTPGHLKLVIVIVICIIIALKFTINKSKEEVSKIIKFATVIIWCLEIIKIGFTLKYKDIKDVNTYVPLYYCSLLLYAGLLSSFGKGKYKRAGDVFIATGGIIGGITFLLCPSTTLPYYPMLHFVSLHSFVYHGIMIYLGLLVNLINYVELKKDDIKYYASLVGILCGLAYIINKIFDSNLMFISQESTIGVIKIMYRITGPFFSLIMSIGQMTIPFYLIYGILRKQRKEEIYINDINK